MVMEMHNGYGHAPWTWNFTMDVDMHLGYEPRTCTFTMDMDMGTYITWNRLLFNQRNRPYNAKGYYMYIDTVFTSFLEVTKLLSYANC